MITKSGIVDKQMNTHRWTFKILILIKKKKIALNFENNVFAMLTSTAEIKSKQLKDAEIISSVLNS